MTLNFFKLAGHQLIWDQREFSVRQNIKNFNGTKSINITVENKIPRFINCFS